MSKKALVSFITIGTLISANITSAAPNFSAQPSTPQYTNHYSPQYGQSYQPQTQLPALKGHVFMVPAGTNIPTVTTFEISSANLTVGQGVSIALGSDFFYNGKMIAPAGSQVNGNVTMVRKAGHAGKNGQLKIRFTNILTPYGQMIPISGTIRTKDGTGILYAATAKDTAKEYTKDLAIGAGAGALMGTIMGPISGGQVGKGAALGTAVGAVGGLGKSLWDKGTDVVIPANSKIDVVIDQPITVNTTPKY